MQVNKIFCDICGKEIEVKNPGDSITMVERISMKTRFNIARPLEKLSTGPGNDLLKDSVVLCTECSKPVFETLEKLRTEKAKKQ